MHYRPQDPPHIFIIPHLIALSNFEGIIPYPSYPSLSPPHNTKEKTIKILSNPSPPKQTFKTFHSKTMGAIRGRCGHHLFSLTPSHEMFLCQHNGSAENMQIFEAKSFRLHPLMVKQIQVR